MANTKRSKKKKATASKGRPREINTLTAEFDALLDRMQRPGAREAMERAFRATPEELGKAAVKFARRRRSQ